MEPAASTRSSTTETAANGNADCRRLELEVRDPIVIKYLTPFDKFPRQDKALEALLIGVIAIQSASPTLDTKVVEDKFRQVEQSIDNCLADFKNDTKTKLEEYFKAGSGTVPQSLEKFFWRTRTAHPTLIIKCRGRRTILLRL
jgi:hypothetical protein